MDGLQGRFPDVAIARLWISFIPALRAVVHLGSPDRALIQAAIITNPEVDSESRRFQSERFVGGQSDGSRRALFHFDSHLSPVGMVETRAIAAIGHPQAQDPDTAEIDLHRQGSFPSG